jgi:hypothetical protein
MTYVFAQFMTVVFFYSKIFKDCLQG